MTRHASSPDPRAALVVRASGLRSLGTQLESLWREYDHRFLATDPVAVPHEFADPTDQEAVALLAAVLAYGNVRQILRSVRDAVGRLGEHPAARLRELAPGEALRLARGFRHRFNGERDLARLWLAMGGALRECGSLGALFLRGHDAAAPNIGPALEAFARALLAPISSDAKLESRTGVPPVSGKSARAGSRVVEPPILLAANRSGKETGGTPVLFSAVAVPDAALAIPSDAAPHFEFLLPLPSRGSACKRLNLFLRWMVRPADGVDFGLWRGVRPAQLLMPLDTHVWRIARALGLTQRRTADWRSAVEITDALRRFDPDDPVRFDFAIARLGIVGRCRRATADPDGCRSCVLAGACRETKG